MEKSVGVSAPTFVPELGATVLEGLAAVSAPSVQGGIDGLRLTYCIAGDGVTRISDD